MKLKKTVLSLLLSASPFLAFAQTGLTVSNDGDVAINFTVNNKSCELSQSCKIAMHQSVVLAEDQLAKLCDNDKSKICDIVFGAEGRGATGNAVQYKLGSGISKMIVPDHCKFCIEEITPHSVRAYHRVI